MTTSDSASDNYREDRYSRDDHEGNDNGGYRRRDSYSQQADNTPKSTLKAQEIFPDSEVLNGISADEYVRMRPPANERPRGLALEVQVDHNFEKALKVLKRKGIKEGAYKDYKARRFYEKPSEKKKRKIKESMKKIRKEEARRKKNQTIF